jgi:hypothetical protein
MGRILVIAVYLMTLGLAQAESVFNPRVATVLGSGNLKPYSECGSTCNKPLVRVAARIPQVGRVTFDFRKRSKSEGAVRVRGERAKTSSQRLPALLKGKAYGHDFNTHAAGNLITLDGQPYLSASFIYQGRSKARLYRIRFPLQQRQKAMLSRASLSSNAINCATANHSHHIPSAFTSSTSISSLSEPVTSASGSGVLELAVYTDAEWFNRFGSLAGAQALSTFQEAELVYLEQFNMDFAIIDLVVDSEYQPTSGSNSAGAVLDGFQAEVLSATTFGEADLYHLLTGIDFDGGTIGVAYVGVLCRSIDSSLGTSSYTNSTLTPVTVAHELGHNFGADHSQSGIMAAVATNESLQTLRFSSTSVFEINDYLSAVNYQCLGDGNSDGATNFPVTLTASVASSGKFNFNITAQTTASNCTGTLHYSLNDGALTPFVSFPVTNGSATGAATFKRTAFSLNRFDRRITYTIAASVSCDAGSGTSSTVLIKPNRVRSRESLLTGKRWFKGLANRLVVN